MPSSSIPWVRRRGKSPLRLRGGWLRSRSCLCGARVRWPTWSGVALMAVIAVAAQVSAVQNISHARALGQVHRQPHRADVDEEVMPQLDETIARHVAKWMKLSGPKLRDRVDLWVAQFDPAGVRVSPKVKDNRYVDLYPASPGMAGLSGYLRAADGAALDQRLDALAATVCDNDPHTKEQRRADACGPAPGPGGAGLPVRHGAVHPQQRTETPPSPPSFTCGPSRPPSTGPVLTRDICPGLASCPPSRCANRPPRRSSKPLQTPAGARLIRGTGPRPKRPRQAHLCTSLAPPPAPADTCGDIPSRICIGSAQAAAIALSSPLLKEDHSTYWRLIRRSQRFNTHNRRGI